MIFNPKAAILDGPDGTFAVVEAEVPEPDPNGILVRQELCGICGTDAYVYRGGLPGVHSMFGGTNWTFYQPTRLGDRITVKVIFKDLIERPSTFAGRSWQQISVITFTNQDGLLLAESEAWGMRTERTMKTMPSDSTRWWRGRASPGIRTTAFPQ